MSENPTHKALALQLLVFVRNVSKTVKAGQNLATIYALFRYFQEVAPAFVALHSMNNDERAGVFGELFDLTTGSDETALIGGFIEGLDAAEEEELLDHVKKVLVTKIQKAV